MNIIEDCLRLDESMSPLPDIDELTHSFEFRKQANYINVWINSIKSYTVSKFIDLIIFEFNNNNYQQIVDLTSKQHELTINYLLKNNIIDIINIDKHKTYESYEIQLTKNAILQLL